MRKSLLSAIVTLSLLILFSPLSSAQVNEYYLVPVDLEIGPFDNTIQVNININTIENIQAFWVLLFAEGACNPVLDTILTGGYSDANPQGFNSPSLVAPFTQRIVYPYGPPEDPMMFIAVSFGGPLLPSNGLYCRMFYKVEGPGTLTFRTAIQSKFNYFTHMQRPDISLAEINWPAEGEVGSFEVARIVIVGDVNYDGTKSISDVLYLISYLYKGGPAPVPEPSAGDVNCDGEVTISDVIYLINYLFRGGPPPGC